MTRLTRPEIFNIVNNYIGVSGGYLGDFSYKTHQEFYPLCCGLDIDPLKLEGLTTRERFIKILEDVSPIDQAKILRGVLIRYPVGSDPLRTQARVDEIQKLIAKLESSPVVSAPSLRITSEIVERAINDAETLIAKSGATSGVDRIHTVLHGYLLAACDAQKITYGNDPSITELFKLLRQHHPKLQNLGARSDDIAQILKAFSAVLDTLNPIRNRASVAHPNAALLQEDEARLVINAARTILHYLDSKLS
jgi:hypothetical protein